MTNPGVGPFTALAYRVDHPRSDAVSMQQADRQVRNPANSEARKLMLMRLTSVANTIGP